MRRSLKYSLLLLLAGCADPETEIRTALRSHLRGQDLALGKGTIVSLSDEDAVVDCRVLRYGSGPEPEKANFLYYLVHRSSGWSVEKDLARDFATLSDTEAFKLELLGRMKTRLEARLGHEVRPTPPFPKTVGVEQSGGSVVGRIQIQYFLSRESNNKNRVLYAETHRLVKGAWVFDGAQFFDAGPR